MNKNYNWLIIKTYNHQWLIITNEYIAYTWMATQLNIYVT